MTLHPRLRASVRDLFLVTLGFTAFVAAPLSAQVGTPATVSPAARAGSLTVTLDAVRDNTLFESVSGDLSNGAGFFLFAGQTNVGLGRRALLAFDIAAEVPSSAVIEAVELQLEMNRTATGNVGVTLHRVTSDWGEGTSDAEGQEGMGAASTPNDATWIHTFFDGATWTNVGGDFDAAASASQTVGIFGFYTWGSTPQMVADVQSWLDDPSSNFGWMLRGDESASRTAKRFSSRENSAPSTRPILRVTYSSEDLLFIDGFESGDTTAWSSQVGVL